MQKKTVCSTIRIEPGLRDKWAETCQLVDQDASSITRELIKAAIRYCDKNGNLYPPFDLVPSPRTAEERAMKSGDVVQVVHNGHGDQKAEIRQRKK